MTTTTNKNKIIACRSRQLLSNGNEGELCKIVSPSWTMQGSIAAMPAGAAGIRKLFKAYENIEQQWSIDGLVAEGNKVVVRATNSFVQYSFLKLPIMANANIYNSIYPPY